MSFFLVLFLIIFVYLIVVPLVKVGMAVHKARKQMRSFFNGMKGDNTQSQSSHTDSRQYEKKIDPNVGEYVEFEEFVSEPSESQSSSETATASRHRYASTSQVEDAEWEEIK